MKIRYTYQQYPNCPRATEYSKSAESTAAYLGMLIGPITFFEFFGFLFCTFSFFGNYNWEEFITVIVFAIVVAIIDFYYFVIRPNNTQCEIKVILTEESNRNLPKTAVQQFCEKLREENKNNNKEEFTKFFCIFLACLFDAVAVIATIKGVYFLFNMENSWFLFLGGIVATCCLSYIIYVLLRGPTYQSASTIPVSNTVAADNTDTNENIEYCRKCGTKVLSDSIFCSKCGTKLR